MDHNKWVERKWGVEELAFRELYILFLIFSPFLLIVLTFGMISIVIAPSLNLVIPRVVRSFILKCFGTALLSVLRLMCII